ncbi:choice-of-anchor R domain-containing protein [Microcystis sp. 0824]|uniref:choice-of-anchor R domain-containing protein n=1 Tax=Microcystis sp. 0824 TaxID=1502726 RepID=UPI000D59E437|nr:choice-of-anchor R domain-containing protein [Microcystis sp. 0824]
MTKNQQILAKMGGGSLAILLSLGLGQQASATTLVSNLPNTTTTNSGYRVKNDNWLGSSFKTGNGSYGYTLNSVTLWFALEPGTSVDPGLLSLKLYDNASGQPGTEISGVSFNVPTINPGSSAQYTFTLTNSQQLASNTNYWLVARSSVTTDTYLWGNTNSPAETGAAGWSIGDTSMFSANQGTSWNSSWINPTGPFQFSVNGTENTPPTPPTNIPEPGSAVALLGLGGLGLASRMKKLSNRA